MNFVQISTLQKKLDKSNLPSDQNLTDKVLDSFKEAELLSNEVSQIVNTLQVATKTQTDSIGQMTQTAQSIASAIQQIGASTQKAMDMITESDRITKTTSAEAQSGIRGMAEINNIVNKSSESVKNLVIELTKINTTVDVITGIAEQTNLLALNAAIEAARAGDTGRGFAVVADEVRRLAENSRKNAEEINVLVKTLQESATTTTKIIEDGTSYIKQNSELITRVLKSLNHISDSVTKMSSQMQEISSATEEISAGSEQAAASSEEIMSVAETNMKNFDEIVLKKDQETTSVQEAGNAAKTLAEIFETLDNSTIVSITDVAGDISYMNKFFIDVSRFQSHELMGQSHRLLKSGFHDPALFDVLWKTISGGKMFSGYVRNKAKDGSIYWVKTTISPTFDEHGKIKGYVGVRTPITELMVLFGIEAAIRQQSAGKKIDKKMLEVIDALKFGKYTVQANY